MKVEFRKISRDTSPFSVDIDGLIVSGSFRKVREREVEVFYKMSGCIVHNCDICGEKFYLDCDESSTLLVSDGEYDGSELDVVETFDHCVDIDYIVNSELEAFKSDYHYCDTCKNNLKE